MNQCKNLGASRGTCIIHVLNGKNKPSLKTYYIGGISSLYPITNIINNQNKPFSQHTENQHKSTKTLSYRGSFNPFEIHLNSSNAHCSPSFDVFLMYWIPMSDRKEQE